MTFELRSERSLGHGTLGTASTETWADTSTPGSKNKKAPRVTGASYVRAEVEHDTPRGVRAGRESACVRGRAQEARTASRTPASQPVAAVHFKKGIKADSQMRCIGRWSGEGRLGFRRLARRERAACVPSRSGRQWGAALRPGKGRAGLPWRLFPPHRLYSVHLGNAGHTTVLYIQHQAFGPPCVCGGARWWPGAEEGTGGGRRCLPSWTPVSLNTWLAVCFMMASRKHDSLVFVGQR